jgi:hypothetical protein
MAKVTFSSKWGKVKAQTKSPATPVTGQKTLADTVREMKNSDKTQGVEDYREKSLAMHGLVCARCSREFNSLNRQLLTVHHKDGNHHYNPADGSNWENLCAYCHDDVHSRGVLADYLADGSVARDVGLVYADAPVTENSGIFADKLKKALQKNK